MKRCSRSHLPSLEEVEAIMHSRRYKLVADYPIEGQYNVSLWQNRSGFAVVYGLQLTATLTYAYAAQELGESLMHALSCQGVMSES